MAARDFSTDSLNAWFPVSANRSAVALAVSAAVAIRDSPRGRFGFSTIRKTCACRVVLGQRRTKVNEFLCTAQSQLRDGIAAERENNPPSTAKVPSRCFRSAKNFNESSVCADRAQSPLVYFRERRRTACYRNVRRRVAAAVRRTPHA